MPVAADAGKQVERVLGRKSPRTRGAPGVTAFSAPAAADRSHFPGRAMTGEVLFLVFDNRVIAHAGEKIVGVVVFADVVETKLPVFAGAQAPLRRAMRGLRVAVGPLTRRQVGAATAVAIRLDADTIKQWRVRTHELRLCG